MSLPVTGYQPRRLREIRDQLESDVRARWGALGLPASVTTVDLGPSTRLGQILDIVAARLAETEKSQGFSYDAFDSRNAAGVYVDNLLDLTGTARLEAEPSKVVLTLTGTADATLGPAQIVRDSVTQTLWRIPESVTFDGGGSATGVIAFCTEDGPTPATPENITQIVTTSPDWASVTNPAAAILGRDSETDEEALVRRRAEMQVGGSGNASAIGARVRAIPGVNQAAVVENNTEAAIPVDGLSIPGRTLALIVFPAAGNEEQIAETLWRHKPPGADTFGGIAYVVTDQAGQEQVVRFDAPIDRNVQVTVTVEVAPSGYSSAAVQDVIHAYFGGLNIGERPLIAPLACRILQVDGVLDVDITYIGVGDIGPLSRALAHPVEVNP